ncbi:MFS transporter [Helicobacter sp. 11S02596-1]|uniref:MFS transporter n=1 Tax=Helicobacter sp. 11S02596-1 TaxID=1476194 RepID=UPI000BA766F7|nr:MFS transporter [Helicobacter sp. 11S02596-1]PAF44016.1 MFS transporter [Helicobacter sp. 11S02596-1]
MGKVFFEEMSFKPIHLRVGIGGIGGQFNDGFILGIVGITIALASASLGLNTWWLGAIGAASLAGLFFGSLLTGPLADKVGRRLIYQLTMPIFCLISILQFFVSSPTELFILRLLLGLLLGADYVVGISLVNEITPARFRGRLLSGMMVGWVGGYAIAYFVGYLLAGMGEDSWRWILLSSAFPSLVVSILRLGTPSSPLWLMRQGKVEQAKEIVRKYFGEGIELKQNHTTLNGSYWELFSPRWRKNTAVGAVFYMCQVIPYFAISTFIPIMLESLSVENPYTGGMVYNFFLLIGSILGLWIIDKISRRSFLIGSFYILAVTLLVLGIWVGMPPFLVIVLFSFFSFVIAGAGVLEFAYTPELFPTALRASGVGFVVAASRMSAALGTFFLPIITEEFSASAALYVCVGALLFGGIFCQIYAPETHFKGVKK